MAPSLFSPITLRGLSIDNRVVVSPMCQYSAVDGSATEWHLMHYGKFAVGGAGLVIIEATHVEPRGRITQGCLGLYSDDNEAALARVLAFCRKHGHTRIGMQISHSGRKGSASLPWIMRGSPLSREEGAWETIAASPLPHDEDWPAPREMGLPDFEVVLEAHLQAVRRAHRLDLDLLELHVAHGYLLHGFLSPLTNRRTDDHGGSLDNRMRFPLRIFRAMRQAWPDDRPMGVRLSVQDWVAGGWTVEESVIFVRALKALGCDYVTASSGGTSLKQAIPLGAGHQVEFAESLRTQADLPTMAVGMIFNPHLANRIIAEEKADFIAIARGMLHDPNWAWSAAMSLGAEVSYPPQYIRAYRSEWLRNQRATPDEDRILLAR